MKKSLILPLCVAITASAFTASAAGTLTPVGATDSPIQIRNHHVDVLINNGFARTEIQQTFFNPNATDLEAIYAFPIPKEASLSEVTIWNGERELNGEVLPKSDAEQIYENEKRQGNDAGLASQSGYEDFEFRVYPVHAQAEARIRIVYYQPLPIDTGIGRYVYPLEAGGTDDGGASFWNRTEQVEGRFSINVELKSAVPVVDLRAPGYERSMQSEQLDSGHYRIEVAQEHGALNRDFVLYYRLADDLPGRIEVVPCRLDASKPGTFMMVLTPGLDLKPLSDGADYIYVLDVSGSMKNKIATLARGVSQALGNMSPNDRFRVVVFNNVARNLVPWTAATPEHVDRAIAAVGALQATGGTNLFDGIARALSGIDAERATSIVLVTDGVTNVGNLDPRSFAQIVQGKDIRVFGFLLGNNANWPLLQVISEASGGFYAGVSNADDISGQILLAKSKITHEAMHDVSVEITGAGVKQTTGDYPGKLYRGQQLVVFGRYESAGNAHVVLKTRISGERKTYQTNFKLPELAADNPEIERLWAMSMGDQVRVARDMGDLDANTADAVLRDLGTTFQIVNEQTAMVVLTDEAFANRGVERRNEKRVATERAAQATRAQNPARDNRVDQQKPVLGTSAPRLTGQGGGGGALDPIAAALTLLLSAGVLMGWRSAKRGRA